ncbi:programmed cell death protein 7 [Alosa alosa]|uniref:programmed cell death protein 7 n=1 Tax=Alosa alosa TaxID=278164 RepID=UPI0020153917|nr:programmed cell death protein 7 [Alosa alosa]
MDNSPYYTPSVQLHQATNPPNMDSNFGGPFYQGPSPGFPPAPYQPPRAAVPGSVDNSSGPNFWAGPNMYQPSQPPNAPPWHPFPPLPPGQGSAGYGYPPPQYQPPPVFEGQLCPPNPPPFEFDPSRPPPGFCEPESNQISAFIEAQRNACNAPQQPEFESHNDGVANHWAHGPTAGLQRNRDSNRSLDTRIHFTSTEFQTVGQTNRDNEMCQRGFNDAFNEPRHQQRYQPLEQHSPLDEETKQRKQDEQWLQNFVLKRKNKTLPQRSRIQTASVSQMREDLYGAVKLVSELSLLCQTLKLNLENDDVWTESYSKAVGLKKNIQEKLSFLSDAETVSSIKKKLATIRKKRIRTRRKKIEQIEEEQKREERLAERHAVIDKWRMKRILKVEEKKREEELKKAADSVLSEVRKKQSDSKKMLDILKALEKLRKLRKEAASRKGVYPEKESDEVFEGHLQRLRALIAKRTAVYNAEEKALRVMLEGEQEEERKRDLEKQQKKERDKFLQKKQEAEGMLFGDDVPPDHPLHAFQDFYLQAEISLPALVQIRREWDRFLVPEEHPDGSAVPQAWVLPEPPADEAWASALVKHISL